MSAADVVARLRRQGRDASDVEAAPDDVLRAVGTRRRVYLVTTYADGTQWHRTGTVGMTTGTRPGLLLMTSARAVGSSDLLTASTWADTVVVGISHGPGEPYYSPDGRRRVYPGRNRYTDAVEA